MIKPIVIIVGAAVIWVASCLLLRKDKGRNKKEDKSPLFNKYLRLTHKLESLMLLKSMLLEEKALI
ncbi:hypothetical protein COM69_15010 [Bacillus toyonensis]|nr:hypothetical protein COM69_15010 [Bacillus toyonensis]PHD44959.1 hypothetical protein COF65_05735 [Bacillus toyonensis]PRT14034.1 hypothetical protein C6353_26500 [Bacillus toyonensis]